MWIHLLTWEERKLNRNEINKSLDRSQVFLRQRLEVIAAICHSLQSGQQSTTGGPGGSRAASCLARHHRGTKKWRVMLCRSPSLRQKSNRPYTWCSSFSKSGQCIICSTQGNIFQSRGPPCCYIITNVSYRCFLFTATFGKAAEEATMVL